jgi:hypothetical protein
VVVCGSTTSVGFRAETETKAPAAETKAPAAETKARPEWRRADDRFEAMLVFDDIGEADDAV